MAKPQDEALIILSVDYPNKLAIPASMANEVLSKLEVWTREYRNNDYEVAPSKKIPEIFLIPEREVIAARMLAHMIAQEENAAS